MQETQNTQMEIAAAARQMKLESPKVAATSLETRNAALMAAKEALAAHADEIWGSRRTRLVRAADIW